MFKRKAIKILTLGILTISSLSLVSCNTNIKNNDTKTIQTIDNIETKDNNKENGEGNIKNLVKEIYDETKLPSTMVLNETFLTDIYGISLDNIEDYGGFVPETSSANELAIIKVKEGSLDNVKKALEERRTNQINTFEKYLPEQYEIIKNSEIIEKNNYIILVSAEPNAKKSILDKINTSFISKEDNTNTKTTNSTDNK